MFFLQSMRQHHTSYWKQLAWGNRILLHLSGSIPTFIGDNDAGICVSPKNPQQLADAIYSLLSNPKKTKELGKKAYERFTQDYTYEKFIQNILAVYEEVLSKKV